MGYAVDWSADTENGILDQNFKITHEGRFRNRLPGIPRFTDHSLIESSLRWDDGRNQVANVWTGTRRYFDDVDLEFKTEDLEERVSRLPTSFAERSRSDYGERRLKLNLSAFRLDSETMKGYIRTALARRLWPHRRGTLSLRGDHAANLRIGDGFICDFHFNIGSGFGFANTCRVIGRTVNMQDEIISIDFEVRDARDEDYQDWAGLNYPMIDGDIIEMRQLTPADLIIPSTIPEAGLRFGDDLICYGDQSIGYGCASN